MCWDPKEKQRWVRALPNVKGVISDKHALPFFEQGVEFEDFVCQFAHWYQQEKGTQVAILIGIRADESLNRYKTIKNITAISRSFLTLRLSVLVNTSKKRREEELL